MTERNKEMKNQSDKTGNVDLVALDTAFESERKLTKHGGKSMHVHSIFLTISISYLKFSDNTSSKSRGSSRVFTDRAYRHTFAYSGSRSR